MNGPVGSYERDLTAWAVPHSSGPPLRWVTVNTSRITENARALCGVVGERVAVMAVVKANAYGHGAVLTARAAVAGGATWLGVSSPEEALQLRDMGVAVPILNLGWTHPRLHTALIGAGIDMTVYDETSLGQIGAAAIACRRRAFVHLKVDTGMGRLGAQDVQRDTLFRQLDGVRQHVKLRGIFTHLADPDDMTSSFAEEQYDCFLPWVAQAKTSSDDVVVHCANSAALLRFPHMHCDMVRPGISLYGYAPAVAPDALNVRPAMSMHALVTHVKTVNAGETVGYGRTWRAPSSRRIATVAAGYADGVQRVQSNTGTVLIGGLPCPIVGRISMDQLTADVSDVETAAPGDEAVLFGAQDGSWLGADDVAHAGGTIAYEVLCAVSARVPRVVQTN